MITRGNAVLTFEEAEFGNGGYRFIFRHIPNIETGEGYEVSPRDFGVKKVDKKTVEEGFRKGTELVRMHRDGFYLSTEHYLRRHKEENYEEL